jgi:hypothetical protein
MEEKKIEFSLEETILLAILRVIIDYSTIVDNGSYKHVYEGIGMRTDDCMEQILRVIKYLDPAMYNEIKNQIREKTPKEEEDDE